MADFGKVNPEKAQAIINALKDGKINSKEIEKLGLTAEEAKALNEAFSSGKVEIGDFVLVNKGRVTKDGKQIQLSSTVKKPIDEKTALLNEVAEKRDNWQLYDSFRAAVKYNKQHNPEVQQASGFGKFLLLGGAAIATMIGASSCSNDDPLVEFGGKKEYDFSTKVDQNVNIPIKLPVIDYTPFFNTLITQLGELKNDQAKNFKAVIEGINAIFAKQNATADDIEAILNTLRKVVNNQNQQIQISTKNGQNFKAFAEELMAILVKMKAIMEDTKLTVEEKTNQIQALLGDLGVSITNIESISADTNETVHEINDKIEKLKGMYDDSAVLAAIDNLAKKGDKANAILEAIYEAMSMLGNDMKSYFGDLIKLAVQNNASLDDLKKLLNEINKNVKANGAQAHDDAQAILAAIKKLGVDVSGNLAAILAAINALPISQQKDYTDALKAILDKINQGNADNNANFKAVIDAIKEHGAKVTVGMNAILEAIQNQPDYSERLDAILKKLDALGDKAQEILEAIKDHDVKITVDVTGKVKCECNCNCGDGGKHEGIIGNLNDLLG